MENEYIIMGIYGMTKVLFREYRNQDSLVSTFWEIEKEDPVVCDLELFWHVQRQAVQANTKAVVVMDAGFAYVGVKTEDALYIGGPVTMDERSEYEVNRYLESHHVQRKGYVIPKVTLVSFMRLSAFFCGLVTNRPLTEDDLFADEMLARQMEAEIENRLTMYRLDSSENDWHHYSYQAEEEAKHYLEMGQESEFQKKSGNIQREHWGKLADTNEKQIEYECVCAITIVTRTAMRAGVLEAVAYGISDVTLQRLSKAKNAIEMLQIQKKAMETFEKEIKRAASLKRKNLHVERTKNFVAKHAFEKITLKDVAEELALNPTYLSRIFKGQEGMTLSEYIMKEKVELSCNMLKYSEESIARIAEYVGLAPQSYYTKVFKKVTGMTPGKYRERGLHG